jgi:soluble lytic murein transglycosylase
MRKTAVWILWLALHHLAIAAEDPGALFARAYALYSEKGAAEAEPLFRQALERHPLLADYSLYFLGQLARDAADPERARSYGNRLRREFPGSVWAAPAALELAKLACAEGDHARCIAELNSLAARGPRPVALESLYRLAEAHASRGEAEPAYGLYRQLRKSDPRSPWSASARVAMARLRAQHPALDTPRAREEEAELLLEEGEIAEAERLYHGLLGESADESRRPLLLYGLALAHRAARRTESEIPLLNDVVARYPGSPVAPSALLRLARIYWNRDENARALEHFQKLLQRYPQSPSAPLALLASARIHESLGRIEEALGAFRQVIRRFPDTEWSREAEWRIAWAHYTRGRHRRAHEAFRALAEKGPPDRYRRAALYWLGRSAERLGKTGEAADAYRKLTETARDDYYGYRAADRLERMGARLEKKREALSLPPAAGSAEELTFHLARAQELARLGLARLALQELDAVSPAKLDVPGLLLLIAHYARHHAHARVVALATRLPRGARETDLLLYPLPHWETIRKLSDEAGIDPYLVAALIRQESLFDPRAISRASALGLMQLLPSTAGRIAAALGLPPPTTTALFEPELNLRLGIFHLRELLQRYANDPVKALAAYNAGEQAVARWERQNSGGDPEEFIERISYRETLDYVKLVWRNYQKYRELYGAGSP